MCDYSKEDVKCKGKKIYGEYCNKHKRNHLIINDEISFSKFTGKLSDYLKDDILKTLNIIDKKKHNRSSKKGELFTILQTKYDKYSHYTCKSESVQLIQNHFKKRYNRRNLTWRGEGFINRKLCNNNEDFYTYETSEEIPDKYFFSYKDESNIIWFFDIRSLKKLIDMNQCNPYTTKPFDYHTIFKANKVIDYLKNNNISVDFIDEMKELIKGQKNILKHKMIDVFASIERLGLSFSNEWFTSLNLNQLKKLYGLMEDIWNYRAELTISMKMLICPPNGIIFNMSHLVIRSIDCRDKLRGIIIDDINKFNSALSDNDNKTGLIYFLIALSQVNPLVFNTHPWILNAL